MGINSGNRYSQVLFPLLTGRDIDRNKLREQILTGSLSLQVEILVGIISGNRYSQVLNPFLTGRNIDRNNLREQILTGSLPSPYR
jgi:hypothetical protein